jgi:hypothetical protein
MPDESEVYGGKHDQIQSANRFLHRMLSEAFAYPFNSFELVVDELLHHLTLA